MPTPLDEHLEPDLSYVRNTLSGASPSARHSCQPESTTYPSTTEEEVVPRLEQGLIPGNRLRDLLPERGPQLQISHHIHP